MFSLLLALGAAGCARQSTPAAAPLLELHAPAARPSTLAALTPIDERVEETRAKERNLAAENARDKRLHEERTRAELELRARLDGIEERLDTFESEDAVDPEIAHLLERREDLVAMIDRVKNAPVDAWPIVRAEAEAMIAEAGGW